MSESDHSLPSHRLPSHVAIIMDGNRRWAIQRGKPPVWGHKKGSEAVEHTVRAAADIGIEYLTLFGFSTENWKRAEDEVSGLIGLLRHYLKSKTAELHKNKVRLRVIGEQERFPKDVADQIAHAETLTRNNEGLQLQIALSYSGRWDLTRACRMIAEKVENGQISSEEINSALIDSHLSTSDIPDVDLMIRTSGELRISNFLLWQAAYAELYFCETLWPDFGKEGLEKAIESYTQRERRFGADASVSVQ